jgi:hypothetical protein
MGFARVGSNPTVVEQRGSFFVLFLPLLQSSPWFVF